MSVVLCCVTDRLMTQKEYIIPLSFDSKSFSLYNKNLPANQQSPIREGISSLEQSVSIRPSVMIDRLAAAAAAAAARLVLSFEVKSNINEQVAIIPF